jgi:hypothetical protein
MTREERQIKAALEILSASPKGRPKRTDIVQMLNIIDTAMADDGTLANSKATKAKVKALQYAVNKVRTAYKHLPEPLKATVFKEPDLRDLLAACKLFEAASLKRPAQRQRLAVVAAQSLLIDYGIPRTVTRKGSWHRLATALYGERKGKRDADLFAYLREFKDIE